MFLDLHLYQKHKEGNSEEPSSDEASQTDQEPATTKAVCLILKCQTSRGLVTEAKDQRFA